MRRADGSSGYDSQGPTPDSRQVPFSASRESLYNAGAAAIELIDRGLRETGITLNDVELFVADIGPGSFIGSRVGVTLVKSLAFSLGKKAAGISAFDLISPNNPVALPSKKGEFFVRIPGEAPYRTSQFPETHLIGYGPGFENPTYPNAVHVASLLTRIKPMAPEALLPEYLIEPSISIPKTI